MALNGLGKPMLGLAAIVLLLGIFVDFNAPIAGTGGIRNVNVHMADGGLAVVSGGSQFLSPIAVFLFMVVFVVCFVISLLFSDRHPPPSLEKDDKHHRFIDLEPLLRPPVHLGEISLEELGAYDGSDYTKPLLLAVNFQIFDVTSSWRTYGPVGKYNMFAGKDASLALLNHSSKDEYFNVDLTRLDAFTRSSVRSLEETFKRLFVKVGTIKKPEGAC